MSLRNLTRPPAAPDEPRDGGSRTLKSPRRKDDLLAVRALAANPDAVRQAKLILREELERAPRAQRLALLRILEMLAAPPRAS